MFSGGRRHGRNLRNLVIIGCGPRGAQFGKEVRNRPELGYLLLGYIDEMAPPPNPLHGHPEKLLGSLEQAHEILATSRSTRWRSACHPLVLRDHLAAHRPVRGARARGSDPGGFL